MRRRPAILIVAGIGIFVFLGLSFLLARGLTGASAERGKVLDLLEAQARGDARAVLAQLPACNAEPACAQVTDARTAELRRPGQVQILNFEPSTRLSLTRRVGSARVAWRAGTSLPVVQCVRVRREGPLTGSGVTLLAVSNPIGLEALQYPPSRVRSRRSPITSDARRPEHVPAHFRRRARRRRRPRSRLRARRLAAADRRTARHVRMGRPAQRARVGVAELGMVAQARARRLGVGQRDAAGRARLGLRGREPVVAAPAAALLVLGRLPGRRGVRAEEEHEEDHAERERDDVERTEDHHQLFIGRHDEILPIPASRATTFRYHRLPLMAAPTDTSTTLDLTSRAAEGSRSARRLRRTGQVPGVIYGGDGNAELFAVDGRILRNTLARSGAILQISVDGAAPGPVLVKDIQRHPVRGEAMHVDFLRVDMNQAIQTTVVLELVGNESAPGVVEGGVLSQGAIELNIEALPGDIPDGIQFDVSTMVMNATATLSELTPPAGVTLLDDPDETVLATITPPSQEPVEEEIETETEVVGEGEEGAEGEAPAEGGSEDESSDES